MNRLNPQPPDLSAHLAPTLAGLGVGQEAEVVHVRGDRRVTRRLLEMGLLPGTRVRVLRVAPLGDPIELALRGYALSVRHVDAAGVVIRALGATAARP